MIVDTSAIMAILADEPERYDFIERMLRADICRLSAGSLVELGAVITRRKIATHEQLATLIERSGILVEAITAELGRIGYEAYRTFGIGSGHRAGLNYGDCFAYALAKATGEPLLFKGDDFIHTDIQSAA